MRTPSCLLIYLKIFHLVVVIWSGIPGLALTFQFKITAFDLLDPSSGLIEKWILKIVVCEGVMT